MRSATQVIAPRDGGVGSGPQAPPPPSESPLKPGHRWDRGDLAPLVPHPPGLSPPPPHRPTKASLHPPREGVSEWARASQGQKVKLTLAAGISGQEMTLLYPSLPGGGSTGFVENLGDECRAVWVVVLSLQAKFSPAGGVLGGGGNPKAPGVLRKKSWGLAERKRDAILSLKSRWFTLAPAARCSLAHTQTCAVIAHRHTHSPVTFRLLKTHPEPPLPCASPHSHGGLVLGVLCGLSWSLHFNTPVYQPYPHPWVNK